MDVSPREDFSPSGSVEASSLKLEVALLNDPELALPAPVFPPVSVI